MNLVGGADEDEGGEEDVEHGIVGHQHQHTVRVSAQPDVILQQKNQCCKSGLEIQTFLFNLLAHRTLREPKGIIVQKQLFLNNANNNCAADFSLLNLPKGKSLGRSKPATNS